jgi:hypothetical protein
VTAARNLHEVGERVGVQRIAVVSLIATDRFTAGYGAAMPKMRTQLVAARTVAESLRGETGAEARSTTPS